MRVDKSTVIDISDVTGIQTLRREDDEITLDVTPRTYPLSEIRAIRDALTAVLDEPADTPETFGPWDRIEDVPDSVKSVRDHDGDMWHRRDNDLPGYFGGETFGFLNHYAPFSRA